MTQSSHKTEEDNHTKPMWFHTFTFTGKERDSETGYGYFGARYMDHELMTMWLSVDPMADKYPIISPYAYCACNPVKLVDPDGREIFYIEGRNLYVYRKGQDGNYGFFNVKTGDHYLGKDEAYVNNLVSALGILKEGQYGNKLVNYFEGSNEHDTYIRKTDDKNRNHSSHFISWNDQSSQDIPIANNICDKVQSEKNTPFVSLGHEMVHVRDRYKNRANNDTEGTALLFENLIRYEHGLNQRTYYGMKTNGMVVFDSEPAPTFRNNLFNMTKGDPFTL